MSLPQPPPNEPNGQQAKTTSAPARPPSQVQISAPKDVLEARIAAFIQRKEQDNNKSNLEEFFRKRELSEDGCARIDTAKISRAPLIKRTRVENIRGPLDSSNPKKGQITESADQRLVNIENFLDLHIGKYSVSPSPPDVYERIKLLEDRILAVEQVLLIHELWKWRGEHSDFVEQELETLEEDPELQYDSSLMLRPHTDPSQQHEPAPAVEVSLPAAPEGVEERINALKRVLQTRSEEVKKRRVTSTTAGADSTGTMK